ncbi:MAG: hypothetical protein OQK12_00675 [Motiliproteus sp.]|nr:hypothetical protein [Motiliproteus sp.]MCW9050912.1 hypothetical protein [Motiliproteus sp.]
MDIKIAWKYVVDGNEELDLHRVLYAYVHPDTEEILYIGKADRCSVKERLQGRHKEDIFDYFKREFDLDSMGLLVGELWLPEGNRYSSELLSDIDSLLIYELEPPANLQAISSRISRPGMVVFCRGDWPDDCDEFRDHA